MESDPKIHRTSSARRSSSAEGKKRGLHRKSSAYKDIKRSKKIFFTAVVVCSFWLLINVFKFYKSEVLAIVVKILFFPMLIILFLIPIVCLLFLLRKKFNAKSYYFYSLILCFITIIFVAVNS